jgi:hypothetical protein
MPGNDTAGNAIAAPHSYTCSTASYQELIRLHRFAPLRCRDRLQRRQLPRVGTPMRPKIRMDFLDFLGKVSVAASFALARRLQAG